MTNVSVYGAVAVVITIAAELSNSAECLLRLHELLPSTSTIATYYGYDH